MTNKKLWVALGLVIAGSFAVLGHQGVRLHQNLPPIPERVVSSDGVVLFTGESISRGQNVWQSIGGQEVGTIWGHGAYVAPDWSADALHRECMSILNRWAHEAGATSFEALPAESRAALQARLKPIIRTNTYDPVAGELRLPAPRVAALAEHVRYYSELFSQGNEAYALKQRALTDPRELEDLAHFFWWTSWVASTNRPGEEVTYTSNWPHEPLIGNGPTSGALLWSVLSVILLIAGIGALVWYQGGRRAEAEVEIPSVDPLAGLVITPSMRATLKYFWVVALLLLAQIGVGMLTAHYGVEGQGFYGIPLDRWLPYAVTRSWHTQLGIFWIATAWLATGLFLAPAIGHEPKGQRLLVNVLFVCLVVIVVGALGGQWLSVQRKLHGDAWYWFGHQGYEYVDLGRFWQLFLFAGLFIWLGLMLRGMWPALRAKGEGRQLLWLFALSSGAIAMFYGAGLMYGQHSHLASVEYWRWWVVHLWVEGFFEVFATVAIALLFVKMGVLRAKTATPAVLLSTIIFLAGGIVGTLHHLYFTGTPNSALALGAVFSALEIVPLSLVGLEVWENLRLARRGEWLARYRWPVMFFVAVAFWNLVGAGVFGFLINPPIALYYMQGLNLTPLHGHTALFGVYGMLGIGMMLFCLRVMLPKLEWSERTLAVCFWSLNGGLAAMALFSLLPVGILQTLACIDHGMWYARSAELLQSPLMRALKWMRVPGDVLFSVGVGSLVWVVLGMTPGRSTRPGRATSAPSEPQPLEALPTPVAVLHVAQSSAATRR